MLRRVSPSSHPDLLVGIDTGDDAAVWRLDEARALVVTVDHITPLVDDARTWGRIAATNAVSDVYAMGGRPLFALNLVGWNRDELPLDLLGDVLEGANDVGREAGFIVAGGHSIDDPEPKFGLVVVGEVDPRRILTNAGFRPGQALVLTKALGVGVVATAIKQGGASPDVVAAAVESMTRLNAGGAAAAVAAGATGATDVTGFGLLGHLARAAEASGVDVRIDTEAVPILPGAWQLAAAGVVPGGSRRNLDWVRDRVEQGVVDDTTVLLLADAQTSGGLLFGAGPEAAAAAVGELRATGHAAAVIATTSAGAGRITLT